MLDIIKPQVSGSHILVVMTAAFALVLFGQNTHVSIHWNELSNLKATVHWSVTSLLQYRNKSKLVWCGGQNAKQKWDYQSFVNCSNIAKYSLLQPWRKRQDSFMYMQFFKVFWSISWQEYLWTHILKLLQIYELESFNNFFLPQFHINSIVIRVWRI